MDKTANYSGKTIDRYVIAELVGTGTFGEVYKAFDSKLSRHVAIKATTPGTDGDDKKLIIREARIHARAEHAHIVPVYDVFENEHTVFIVMRLVTGENLDQMISRQDTPLRLSDAWHIMHQILWGMDYAHSKGIVHLDLKPGNIRITHCGEALIMDFGIAAILGEQDLMKERLQGTPAFMAPEIIESMNADARSDIYSLGLIMYKMITGHHPFEHARSLAEMLGCHKEVIPAKPSTHVASIPEKLDDVIIKALEKNSRSRYHSCREFAMAMEHAISGTSLNGTSDMELRWDPRVAVYLNARIQLVETGELISAETVNLSVSGARLRVAIYIAVGSDIYLELYLPEGDHYIKVAATATVLWADGSPGMENVETGISLNEIDKQDRYHISMLVSERLLSGDEAELPGDDTVIFS